MKRTRIIAWLAIGFGLAISGTAACEARDPALETGAPATSSVIQASSAGTDWRWWSYTSGGYAFNPGGSCTDNCSTCNGCYPTCPGTCNYYHNCPSGSYDLDWSGGYFGRDAILYLPCSAVFESENITSYCGQMWQPHFRCVDGVANGKHFLFNHLQHPDNAGNGWLVVGHTYNAGTPIGKEGGTLANEGYPNCSSGNHVCMEVPTAEGAPCNTFPTNLNPACGGYSNADGPNASQAGGNVLGCAAGGGLSCSGISPWYGAGVYCGSQISGANPSQLYSCSSQSGTATPGQVCSTQCVVNGPGAYCQAPPPFCGPNNSAGYYCGSDGMSNADPNKLYHCSGSSRPADANPIVCGSPGCQVAPPGWADYCYNLHNPGYGWWCGYDATQGYANHRYYWSGSRVTDLGNCAKGCVYCKGCADYCR